MWLFEEKQQMAGFVWVIILILAITIAAVVIPFIFVPEDISELKVVIPFVLTIDIVIIFVLTYFFRFLYVRADEEKLEFGFRPFIVSIPFDQIKSARLVEYGLWRAGGLGIRLGRGGRWNYIAKIGRMVEVDWGDNKKHGFSIRNHEELSRVFRDYVGDKFTIAPEFIQKEVK